MIYNTLNRLIGLIFLLLFSPLILLIAFFIKIDSPGKVIFSQTRVGKDGRVFTFYKFRTMWKDAIKKFPVLYSYEYSENEIASMKFKITDDPRVTKFGRYLRKTSLDELPNLINVVKGEMYLVGPRPEIPEMIKYYEPWQLEKFSVKPGITGLAQVNGRGLLTFQQTIDYDLMYIREKNIWLDNVIFGKTLGVVLRSFGAF
jgi:lipopolysaccharide/colanic/teichoic acid biosynthesis glycosyltransferase